MSDAESVWASESVALPEIAKSLDGINGGPDAIAFTVQQRRSWVESRGVKTYFGRHTERWTAWFTTAGFDHMDLGWFATQDEMVQAAEAALELHGTWEDMVKGALAYLLRQHSGASRLSA